MGGAKASAFQARSAFQQDILFAFGGGDPRITIAVLDGPVDRTHECFRGARLVPVEGAGPWRGADNGAVARGSHAASVIFGQPCTTVEGIAPLCRGLIVPVFTDRGGCSSQALARAIILALGHGAQLIYVGAGRLEPSEDSELLLTKAITMCRRRNVLIMAAAPDEGGPVLDQAEWGAPVLSVRALEPCGAQPEDDNPGIIALPGKNIIGAALEGGVARRSGAASAAALLTGLAGVLLGRQLRLGRAADPLAIRNALLQVASDSASSEVPVLRTRDDIERVVDELNLRRGSKKRFPFDLAV